MKLLIYLFILLFTAFQSAYTLDKDDKVYKKIFSKAQRAGKSKALDNYRSFNSKNLYEEINGGASVYLDYHFYRLAKNEFVMDKDTVIVEMYDMKAPINAYGMFAINLDEEAKLVSAGTQGCFEGRVLVLWKNKYYVRLFSYQPVPEEKMLKLGKGFGAAIPKGPAAFSQFKVFDLKNLVKHSKKYHPVAFLGVKHMDDVYSADLMEKGKKITLFYKIAKDKKEAGRLFNAVADMASKNESLKQKVAGNKLSRLVMENDFEGRSVVTAQGKYIYGLRGEAGLEETDEVLAALFGKIKGLRAGKKKK